MRWFPKYSVLDLLNEPICIVGYLSAYANLYEVQENEKVKLMALGGTLKGMT